MGDHTPEATVSQVAAAMTRHRERGEVDAAHELAEQIQGATLGGRRSLAEGWAVLECAVTELIAGDGDRAVEVARRAHRIAEEAGDPTALHDGEELADAAAALLAVLHACTGACRHAQSWLTSVSDQATSSRVVSAGHVAAGNLHLEALRPDLAARELRRAGDGTESLEIWPLLTGAWTQWAILAGDPLPMLDQVARVRAVHGAEVRGDGVIAALLVRCEADLLMAMGELTQARTRMEGQRGPWTHSLFGAPQARLALLAGDADAAQRMATEAAWQQRSTLRDRAELHLVHAAAELQLGHQEAAAEAFQRGYQLAAHGDLATPYLTLEPRTRQSLVSLATDDETAEVDLPPQLKAGPSCLWAEGDLVELTPREHAVLAEMARRTTLAEIARELSVSLNTVKKQSVSIYRKLSVGDRAAALVRAHRLGLLVRRCSQAD